MPYLLRLLRAHIGVLLLLFYCLSQNVALLARSILGFVHGDHRDPVTAFENRFTNLHHTVVHTRRVGYVTDIPQDQPALWFQGYFLTQYTLSPTIVDNSTTHSLIIGNYSDASAFREARLPLLVDYGHGVVLLSGNEQ